MKPLTRTRVLRLISERLGEVSDTSGRLSAAYIKWVGWVAENKLTWEEAMTFPNIALFVTKLLSRHKNPAIRTVRYYRRLIQSLVTMAVRRGALPKSAEAASTEGDDTFSVGNTMQTRNDLRTAEPCQVVRGMLEWVPLSVAVVLLGTDIDSLRAYVNRKEEPPGDVVEKAIKLILSFRKDGVPRSVLYPHDSGNSEVLWTRDSPTFW